MRPVLPRGLLAFLTLVPARPLLATAAPGGASAASSCGGARGGYQLRPGAGAALCVDRADRADRCLPYFSGGQFDAGVSHGGCACLCHKLDGEHPGLWSSDTGSGSLSVVRVSADACTWQLLHPRFAGTQHLVAPRLKADDKTAGMPLLAAAAPGVDVEWPSFLARADPVNAFDITAPNTIPNVWLEGSFAGNGMIGAQVLICPGGVCRQSLLLGTNTTEPDQSLPHQAVIPLARGDVSDIRSGDLAVTCNPTAPPPYNTCGISGRTARPRFGIGDLVLGGASPIIRGSIRTHLHNATVSATLTTAKGELSFSVHVHARRQLVVVEGLRGSRGEAGATLTWEFRPAPALPPGLFKELAGGGFTGAPPAGNYTLNPAPVCTASSCRQALIASPEGRGWVSAWQRTDSSRLLVAVTSDLPRPVVPPKTIRATAEAVSALAAAVSLGAAALKVEHTGWWAEYYWSTTSVGSSGAFLSLPAAAARIEQFHWIQVFKVGAENACRRFADSAYSAQPSYLDNCILLDGINGPLSVSKTKWSDAIWYAPSCCL
jgi:hypothetical protein